MKKTDNNNKNKSIKRPCNVVILFTVIYVLMVLLSGLDRVATLKDLSTTDVTFVAVAKEFWFSIAVIVLLVVNSIVYMKKEVYGVALELAIGLSMLVNVLISVITVGFDIGALLATLVIPAILIAHSVIVLIKLKKQKSA